jgi:mannose/fructose/N-acetylgalactosamine-specific phosphotransferase system component IIC
VIHYVLDPYLALGFCCAWMFTVHLVTTGVLRRLPW